MLAGDASQQLAGPSLAAAQVFTPAAVAELALSLALDGSRAGASVFDPACGDGMFLGRAVAGGTDPSRVYGLDIDAALVKLARTTGAHVACRDFLYEQPKLYDAVVGNPPYVRHERLPAAMVKQIGHQLARDWPQLDATFAGRTDLALAFLAHALRFVRPGGRLAFVMSQAAFDAGYSQALREFLPGRARLLAVVVSPRERWFKDAAVHGMIVVLQRTHERKGPPTLFARLSVPVSLAATRVGALSDLTGVAHVRSLPQHQAITASWKPLLRAPDVWFQWQQRAGDGLVPLGHVATVKRGATSGANRFFYMSPEQATEAGIEPACLVPLFKTPRHARSICVSPDELPTVAFCCPPSDLEKYPGAQKYVDRHKSLVQRPSLASRDPWWSLPACRARLFLTKAYDARFVQQLASKPVFADQRVYTINSEVDLTILAAVLNSSFTALAIESLGRASMGEGALELSVGDANQLPIVDPARIARDPEWAARVRVAFAAIVDRPVGTVADEQHAPDRIALDRAVSPPEWRDLLPAIRQGLVSAVQQRVQRATVSPSVAEIVRG